MRGWAPAPGCAALEGPLVSTCTGVPGPVGDEGSPLPGAPGVPAGSGVGVRRHLLLLGNIRSQSLHSRACPPPPPPRPWSSAAPTGPHAYFLWRRRSSLDWKSSSHSSQRKVGSPARERVGRGAEAARVSPAPAPSCPASRPPASRPKTCPHARSMWEEGPALLWACEEGPALGSGEGGPAKCLVYESGGERRQSSNACHKLLLSRSNKLKGGAAMIMLPRQHPDWAPSCTAGPGLSVSGAGRGGPSPVPAPPQQLPDAQQLLPSAQSPPGPRGPASHPGVQAEHTRALAQANKKV